MFIVTDLVSLSTTNFVAYLFRARLYDANKPYTSKRDKIVKIMIFCQNCDGEFNNKHIGVNLCSFHLSTLKVL